MTTRTQRGSATVELKALFGEDGNNLQRCSRISYRRSWSRR